RALRAVCAAGGSDSATAPGRRHACAKRTARSIPSWSGIDPAGRIAGPNALHRATVGGDAMTSGGLVLVPRRLAFARIPTSSASGRSRMMPSPELVVGKSLTWIARREQGGLGRQRGGLDPPAVPTDPEVMRGAEGQIPLVSTIAHLLLWWPHKIECATGEGGWEGQFVKRRQVDARGRR